MAKFLNYKIHQMMVFKMTLQTILIRLFSQLIRFKYEHLFFWVGEGWGLNLKAKGYKL
jgi:hypothetical protein